MKLVPRPRAHPCSRTTRIAVLPLALGMAVVGCKSRDFNAGATEQSWNASAAGQAPLRTGLVIDASGADAVRPAGAQGHGLPGAGGGEIKLRIEYADGLRRKVRIQGEKIKAGSRPEPFEHLVDASMVGTIHLKASGGKGATGVPGAPGVMGAAGASGIDAQCPSTRASDGLPGGRGGPGAPGSNGGRGGDGGKVTATVKADATELLWLLSFDITGGRPGFGGLGGVGGPGGTGGKGGLPASCGPTQLPPGSDGRLGNRGDPGSSGYVGNAGTPGKAAIVVVDGQGGTKSFARSFEFGVEGASFQEEFPDGVYEPGERLSLVRARVSNSGEFATPSKKVTIEIETAGAVAPAGASAVVSRLELQEALSPGQSKDVTPLPGQATFAIAVDSPKDAFSLDTFVRIGSLRLPTGKKQAFELGYPVTLAIQPSARGTGSAQQIVVKNVSKATYGGSQGIARKVILRLSPTGVSPAIAPVRVQVGERTIVVDRNVDWEVPSLAPEGQTTLQVLESAPLKALNGLRLELLIEGPSARPGLRVVAATELDPQNVRPALSVPNAAPFPTASAPYTYRHNLGRPGIRCELVTTGARRNISSVRFERPAGTQDFLVRFDTWLGFFGDWSSPKFKVGQNVAPMLGAYYADGRAPSTDEVVRILNEYVSPVSTGVWRIADCEAEKRP